MTLRYKFAVGQVRRYQYDAETDVLMQTGQTGAGIPISMTTQTTMRQTVKSIRPADGAATIVTQIESVRALRNGQEVPVPGAQQAKMKEPFTQVMLPTGEILSLKSPALSGAGMPNVDFSKGMFGNLGSTVALPAGQVKVGDTWNSTGAVPGVGLDIASKSTLISLAQKDSAALATIENTQTATINKPMTEGVPMKIQGQLTGKVSQVFDMSAGALQSMNGSASTDMTMSVPQSTNGTLPTGMPSAMKMQMQMKYTMERLSDTPPPAQ